MRPTKNHRNLNTFIPYFNFPGLKGGDRKCLCPASWQEDLAAGVAAQSVVIVATHVRALE
ncbi:DUF2237 family protein [Anabaena sp. PCC 7938]|uniref:DUF2237 family protein n=1 Tax=Anabaena TaxID=1163 RepID=UPI001F558E74|nr:MULTISPECIES: DUF2237 family protein [Anabaena]MCM2409515.1 DUF2237 domain-containing protein [Anabaena sp. CCAP 1446/1C]